jgi:hypothetical protein
VDPIIAEAGAYAPAHYPQRGGAFYIAAVNGRRQSSTIDCQIIR